MKKLIIILVSVFILLVTSVGVWIQFSPNSLPFYIKTDPQTGEEYDCNRISLGVHDGVSVEQVKELASKYNLRIKSAIPEINSYELQTKGFLCSTKKLDSTILKLNEEKIVEYAERTGYGYIN